jgi:SAM-dependent methyltransferase
MNLPAPQQAVDLFYRAFEERNRGSRELIKSRLLAYLPFIEPIQSVSDGIDAIDLGCGRGEWLEVLRDRGLRARGVDLDEGMLASCRLQNLDAHQGNALDFLQSLPENSVSIVSAFHVVEHISFEQLRLLLREAFRVLRAGGLLILETPNPENIVVGTSLFYLDPSHVRPIPSELLSFAVEFEGFARNTVVRLQESASLKTAPQIDLIQVLNGVSPDYAVVAQKSGDSEFLEQFDDAFGRSYGISLNALAGRYQSQENNRHDQLATQTTSWIDYGENRFLQSDERFTYLDNRQSLLEKRLAYVELWLSRFNFLLGRGLVSKVKKTPKWCLRKVHALVRRFPWLYELSLTFAHKTGLYSFLYRIKHSQAEGRLTRLPDDSTKSSARVDQIHAQLKKAQKGHQESN